MTQIFSLAVVSSRPSFSLILKKGRFAQGACQDRIWRRPHFRPSSRLTLKSAKGRISAAGWIHPRPGGAVHRAGI